ncbi:hypothetical protein [Mangrovicoccus ximenensis]|uniref:hypothetical protein n=1 Tax=Mangrovicoccus ximenensis TaxID=1911570 RepID=UPI000D366FCD|nr:hypothetical protein [Mangrovicoccus ximenensis]
MAKFAFRSFAAAALIGAAALVSGCSAERVADNTVDGAVAVTGYAAKGTYAVAKAGVKGGAAVARAMIPGVQSSADLSNNARFRHRR